MSYQFIDLLPVLKFYLNHRNTKIEKKKNEYHQCYTVVIALVVQIILIAMIVVMMMMIIIIISRCYVKANSFLQFLCPKFALTYVEFALTSSCYSYGINPIVGIRLNVEYMLVIVIIIIIIIVVGDCGFHSTLFTKRLLTVNTMYYMNPQKANLKVMDP